MGLIMPRHGNSSGSDPKSNSAEEEKISMENRSPVSNDDQLIEHEAPPNVAA